MQEGVLTKIEFIDEEVTSWGGVAILKRMLDASGFVGMLGRVGLPAQGSNRGYDPVQIVLGFMCAVWCGAERYAHLDVTRFDGCLQRMFGWERMPEHKAYERYFRKFGLAASQRVFGGMWKWFFGSLKFGSCTLDLDSSVLSRYGSQEAAAKGYNPRKPGRRSHHPLLAFVADAEMVANLWLRPGDAHGANNFQAFLEETLHFLGGRKVKLLRLDTGFFGDEAMGYLEKREDPINYIVATPMYQTIQAKLGKGLAWLTLEDGIEVAEFEYQAKEWKGARRMVAVRQKVAVRPQAPGKQLTLFEDDIEIKGYRYTCYTTSLDLPPAEVWRLYRGRANCENRIKELKYDYSLDKLNQESFQGTEASLRLMAMAYNFLSLFKQLVIGGTVRQRLATLRHKMLAIPAIVQRTAGTLQVKMALHMNRRSYILKLFKQIDLAYARDG